ncbi:hypothetical protein Q3G72_006361 [Acer saccharum]|nr:hypothetical protein Q3G72_006361 [Acer saccharum]
MFTVWQWKPIDIGFEDMMKVLSTTVCSFGFVMVKLGESLNVTVIKTYMFVSLEFFHNLVKMYGRYSMYEEADAAFNNMKTKNIFTVNEYLYALCMVGLTRQAFEVRYKVGTIYSPTIDTYVILMNGCVHYNLVANGLALYDAMKGNSGVKP